MAGSLLIRADASEGTGTGHVMRQLALAQAWQASGGRATMLSHCPAAGLVERIRAAGIGFEPLARPHPDPSDLQATLDLAARMRPKPDASTREGHEPPAPWVVLDGYHFDDVHQSAIRFLDYRLLVVDDTVHLPYYNADLVLNQNLGAEPLKYVGDEHTTLLLGPRYALLRPEFRRRKRATKKAPETACRVLITLGGEDPQNVTRRVVHALEQLDLPGLEARIVLGPANPHAGTLRAEIERSSANLQLLTEVTDMPGLMAWADVAVTGAGTTCWELALMQVPSVALVLAENQRIVAEGLAHQGVVVNLGAADRLGPETIARELASLCRDRGRRAQQREAGRRLVDGRGSERVVAVMEALDGPIPEARLTLRRVADDDMLAIWRLANAPSVRQSSLSPDPIPLDAHVKWFRENLSSADTRMWALDLEGLPVGQIRYERDAAKTVLVNFSVPAPFRRRGLGRMLVERTRKLAADQLGAKRLRAVVLQGNAASARVFVKLGFTEVTSKPVRGKPCYVFEQEL